MKYLCTLALIFLSLAAYPKGKAKPLLTGLAQAQMQSDSELQNLKSRLHFKLLHPALISHGDYQTLIYHEVFDQLLSDGRMRQWEVIGGDVRVHFIDGKSVVLQKHIFESVPDLVNLEILNTEQIKAALRKQLHRKTISDFKVSYKLWTDQQKSIPVFWIRIRLEETMRDVALNAVDGSLLLNSDSRRHLIQVRNGRKNNARTNRLGDGDELTPAILDKYKNFCQLISFRKDSEGEPLLVQPENCEMAYDGAAFTSAADASVKRALSNSQSIVNFFGSAFGQWDLDFEKNTESTKKTPVQSIVHIGEALDNAYWDDDLKAMLYGDGSGGTSRDSTRDYTLALDIAGHEFTHGIVSQTAKFLALGEPGALNEAFADIFGILIEHSVIPKANWSIGRLLYSNSNGASDEVALRSLEEPHKFTTSTIQNGKTVMVPFPEKYSERLAQRQKCTDENDQCEVHANSTIWSHAAYLMYEGFVNQLGMQPAVAEKILSRLYFITLTHRLHENESMKSAAVQLLEVCRENPQAGDCEIVLEALTRTELN